MTTIQTNQIGVHQSKHASVVKNELSEEDKTRLQAIDDAIINGFRKTMQIPQLQVLRNQLQPISTSGLTGSSIEISQQNNELNSIPMNRRNSKEESKQIVHDDEQVQKFIIDVVWRTVYYHKKEKDFIFYSDNDIKLWSLITQEEEKDIEIVMEEPLMRYNSCTSKKYKKKEIIRINDVLIKNVSISNIDNVLWNSIEKLYWVNKNFVRLSDKLDSDIGPEDFLIRIWRFKN
ncbi:MAG: hypothetical protein EZS28_007098 [Streblomastix strix]|uniref:Uncharacterized protein n=1 Tax=Streblomastix strix TaxID=222440 RepID=A0A5J4WQD8_9EUKA|nr:MAG: hypothetical protein EZS28_007098 [Streblomastix strix]